MSEKFYRKPVNGNINIDTKVIARYASDVIKGFDGIAGLSKKNHNPDNGVYDDELRGIDANINEDAKLLVDFHVIIAYGANIKETSERLAMETARHLEKITGFEVAKVNVHVDDIQDAPFRSMNSHSAAAYNRSRYEKNNFHNGYSRRYEPDNDIWYYDNDHPYDDIYNRDYVRSHSILNDDDYYYDDINDDYIWEHPPVNRYYRRERPSGRYSSYRPPVKKAIIYWDDSIGDEEVSRVIEYDADEYDRIKDAEKVEIEEFKFDDKEISEGEFFQPALPVDENYMNNSNHGNKKDGYAPDGMIRFQDDHEESSTKDKDIVDAVSEIAEPLNEKLDAIMSWINDFSAAYEKRKQNDRCPGDDSGKNNPDTGTSNEEDIFAAAYQKPKKRHDPGTNVMDLSLDEDFDDFSDELINFTNVMEDYEEDSADDPDDFIIFEKDDESSDDDFIILEDDYKEILDKAEDNPKYILKDESEDDPDFIELERKSYGFQGKSDDIENDSLDLEDVQALANSDGLILESVEDFFAIGGTSKVADPEFDMLASKGLKDIPDKEEHLIKEPEVIIAEPVETKTVKSENVVLGSVRESGSEAEQETIHDPEPEQEPELDAYEKLIRSEDIKYGYTAEGLKTYSARDNTHKKFKGFTSVFAPLEDIDPKTVDTPAKTILGVNNNRDKMPSSERDVRSGEVKKASAGFKETSYDNYEFKTFDKASVPVKKDDIKPADKIPADKKPSDKTPKVSPRKYHKNIGIIACSSGEGIDKLFHSKGVDVVIPVRADKPADESLFKEAIEHIEQTDILILPNDRDSYVNAKAAADGIADKNIDILHTLNITQGIEAMICFMPDLSLSENAILMSKEVETVKNLQVLKYEKDTFIGSGEIKEGQFAAIGDDGLCAADDNADRVILLSLSKVVQADTEILSIYYGMNVTEEEANILKNKIELRQPGLDVELHNGGMEDYHYLISSV